MRMTKMAITLFALLFPLQATPDGANPDLVFSGDGILNVLDPNSICRASPLDEDQFAFIEAKTRSMLYFSLENAEIRILDCFEVLIVEIERDKIPPGAISMGGQTFVLVVKQSETAMEILHSFSFQ